MTAATARTTRLAPAGTAVSAASVGVPSPVAA